MAGHTVLVDDLEEHRRILGELIGASGDVSTLAHRLGPFQAYDVEPLVTLGTCDVVNILERFLDGHLSVDDVGIWAETLEMRDDVDFGEDGTIARALFDLASEGLGSRPITRRLAQTMIAELRGPAT